MCANVSPTTASLSTPPSTGRSLFSRLTSPLKSRTRNLTEFYIRPNEPHRQYSPGDIVKGAVVLKVEKPIRLTHLTVCLHGFVRVFKHPNGVKEPSPELTASGNSSKSHYFGNGHASLFQDEVTLCGEGRLDVRVYEFNFELEFPTKGLPSSIDFERGTISYMITATITRPTSITATSSCEQKISLVETVDIGPLVAPKPRVISLEPISRRTRRRKTVKNNGTKSSETAEPGSGSEARAAGSPLPDDSVSHCGSNDHQATPRSPVPSEIQSTVSTTSSTGSTISSSTGRSFRLAPAPSARSARNSREGSQTFEDKTITATVDLLKSGSLPGDNIPIKISIKHTKALKSMHGIIITFYRQGRIDSAPPLSMFTDIKGKEAERLKHEEYYPKSKTGLGGLSLSSAGSSSMFRKDLAQTFAPILVDPTTLSAVINASVRVPEDVFPTICGVPGEMISFRYYVEAVIDLGGKLARQQQHVPRIGAIALPSGYGTSSGARPGGNNPDMMVAWGRGLVETDHIRREKSVVACVFEVVVGTKDSARVRRRGNSNLSRQNDWADRDETVVTSPPAHEPIYEESINHEGQNNGYYNEQQPYPYYEEGYEGQYPEYYGPEGEGYEYEGDYAYDHYPPPPAHANIHVPPPEIAQEEGLTDKERARRAEERLLPSQPPPSDSDVAGPSNSGPTNLSLNPSAPPGVEVEVDLYGTDDTNTTPQATFSMPSHLPIHNHQTASRPNSIHNTIRPSAPALSDLHPSASQHPTEDKQELERRRLLAEASAPSEFPNDDEEEERNAGEGSSGLRGEEEPSAPILHEDGYGYGSGNRREDFPDPSTEGGRGVREELPRYER